MAGFILLLPSLSPHLSLAKDKKKDPEEIGNRDVGRGINFSIRLRKRWLLAGNWRKKWNFKPRSSTIQR